MLRLSTAGFMDHLNQLHTFERSAGVDDATHESGFPPHGKVQTRAENIRETKSTTAFPNKLRFHTKAHIGCYFPVAWHCEGLIAAQLTYL